MSLTTCFYYARRRDALVSLAPCSGTATQYDVDEAGKIDGPQGTKRKMMLCDAHKGRHL